MENTFTIYKLSNYYITNKTPTGNWHYMINKETIGDPVDVYTGTIDKVIKRLEKDKGYHLRINPDKDCIVFGDLDHIPTENIFNDFINRVSVVFGINKDDISYTLSNKENELSYHWSIPSIESNTRTIKTMLQHNNFISFKNYIDLSIYSVKWFRLPEQSNKNKPLKHKIINGKPSDFIFEYINNTTDEIKYKFNDTEIKPEIKPKDKNKSDSKIEQDIDKCLFCLNIDDYNNFDQWCNIALIINNELGYNGLNLLDEWSSEGEGYDKNKVEQFYKNIKPKENGLKIGSLKKMAKEANPDLYKQLFKKNKENKIDDNGNKIDDNGVFNDLEAAKKVYELYKYWKYCDNKLFVYDDNTGMWTESEIVMFSIISRFDQGLYLLIYGKNGEIKKTSKGYGNSTALQRQLLPQLKTLCIDNNWLINTNLSSMNKILFLNGYYNMDTGIFNKIFNPNIVFFYRVERDYENNIDSSYLESVKQRFFYNQLGEDVGNYLLLNIARALAGNRMKKIFFGLGETDAGKSTYVNATINTFGDYIGTFNGENLCIKNSMSDEAQLMRWAFLLRYKRIIFSNEMKNESVLSGNMMKKISSGGDTLVGRTHCSEEKSFIPHFNVFCNANDLLEIKPFDSAINTRLNIISYKKKYVDEPSNEFELKKDNNIENEMKTINFINTFQYILFDSYLNYYKNGCKESIPDAVKNCKTEWVGDQAENTCINKFLESYEITNNVEHYTKSADIDTWVKDSKLSISTTKFTMELKKYCSIKKYINVESKNKKINGKVPKVWIGIKKIIDDDNEDINSLDII